MLSIASSAAAQDADVAITSAKAKNGVSYHLRIPAALAGKRGARALVLLHGSNSNAKDYVATAARAWPELARERVLLGVDGETRVAGSPDDAPRFNYSYTEFAGKSRFKGTPASERQSPALVAEVVREVKEKLSLGAIVAAGHSQGGFLSYSLVLNEPELFAGAVPISAGLLVQCAPDAFEDAAVKAKQRRLGLAIVHAKNDTLVPFDMAQEAREEFIEAGHPRVKLFESADAAHAFALLPVEKAVRWLDDATSEDASALAAFAETSARDGEWRDALAAVERARETPGAKKVESRLKAVERAVEAKAEKAAKPLKQELEKAKDATWVERFRDLRAQFGLAKAAQPVLELHQKLREKQDPPAEELWQAAQADFQRKDPVAAKKKLKELVERYPAATRRRAAKATLDQP